MSEKTSQKIDERFREWILGLGSQLFTIVLAAGLLAVVGILVWDREIKELSYSIDGPIAYLDEEATQNVDVEIKVGDEVASNIYGYRVRLWNSGNQSLDKLPVDFDFSEAGDDFRILNIVYGTTDEFEHYRERITQTVRTTNFVRLEYEFLDDENSAFWDFDRVGHQDNVSFITTAPVALDVNAIAEDVAVTEILIEDDTVAERRNVFSFVVALLFVGVVLASISILNLVFNFLRPFVSPPHAEPVVLEEQGVFPEDEGM